MTASTQAPVAQFDVAVVGCGPVGALLANLLGQAGLSVVVLERDRDIHALPRAVHFDGEVMRIFQRVGLAEAIAGIARPSNKGMHFLNADGDTLLVRRGIDGPGPHGWTNNWYAHQPHLDAALRRGLVRYPELALRVGCDVDRVDDAGDHVRLGLVSVRPGEAPETVTARYVVGCDGARSLVRQTMGSPLDDLGLHQPWLVVDLLVDPDSERVRALTDYTIQLCDPARPMTLVHVGGQRRRWEIMLMPGDVPEEMTREDAVWRLLAPWLAPGDARIERGALYTFHSLVATRWRDRRLLIAGDAAHQTPPFLGQGMCAGVRDAANLAWKLVRVLKGRAPEALLDTYQTERDAHVRVFIATAVRLGGIIQTTDPEVAAERDRRFLTAGKEEIVNLSPALGPGAHGGEPPAGEIFPQPRLADGRRLDAAIGGYRFALLAERALLGRALAQRCQSAGVATVPADGEAAERLRERGARGALLRPDRYIYGIAHDRAGLTSLVEPFLTRVEALP